MQEQDRLAMGAHLGLAIAQDTGAFGLKAVARRNDVVDFIADVMDATVRVATRTVASITSAMKSTTSFRRATALRPKAPVSWAMASPRWAPMASRSCSCIPRISSAPWSNSNRHEVSGALVHRPRDLLHCLVAGVLHRAAVRHPLAGGARRRGAWYRSGRPEGSRAQNQAAMDDRGVDDCVC